MLNLRKFCLSALGFISLTVAITKCYAGAPGPLPRLEHSLVGTLPGDFSVDNKGSANYSIPLEVPPAANGLQPNVAISYNSNGGNGIMGIGFGLSAGQSSITRGRSILARDGEVRGIEFSNKDKLYLDGKRLVPINDKHWVHGCKIPHRSRFVC